MTVKGSSVADEIFPEIFLDLYSDFFKIFSNVKVRLTDVDSSNIRDKDFAFSIESINGLRDEFEFNDVINNASKSSLQRVYNQISSFSPLQKYVFIEDALRALSDLIKTSLTCKSLIVDVNCVYDIPVDDISFANINFVYNDELIVIKENDFDYDMIHSFAFISINSLKSFAAELLSIKRVLLNAPDFAAASDEPNLQPVIKIKTNFSVPELAYFFWLLARDEVFDVPEGSASNYCRMICNNFSSKKRDNIALDSFSSQYFNSRKNPSEYVKTTLHRLLQLANQHLKEGELPKK